MIPQIVLNLILCFAALNCYSLPTRTYSSNTTEELECFEEVAEVTLPPLDICSRVNKLLKLQNEDIDILLSNYLGRSYDPLTTDNFAMILDESFTSCRKTPDFKFHMPNNYNAELIFERRLDKSASQKENFEDTSESTCTSVAGDSTINSQSGSGSINYQETKKKMVKQKKSMFQMVVKNTMYRLSGDLSSKFSASFMLRLHAVIRAVEKGFQMQAKYFVQKILSDFGTHVTIEAIVGTQSETRSFASSSTVARCLDRSVQAQASASNGQISVAGSGALRNSNTNRQESSSSGAETWVMTDEGMVPLQNVSDFDPLDDSKPVILSRQIIPIYMMMEKHNLGTNHSAQEDLQTLFEEATIEYVERNTIQGCTNRDKTNYDYQANYNDGMCDAAVYEVDETETMFFNLSRKEQIVNSYGKTFIKINGVPVPVKKATQKPKSKTVNGGIFRKCSLLDGSKAYDVQLNIMNKSRPSPCDNYQVANFVTSELSCEDWQKERLIISYNYVLPEVHIIDESTHCFNETEVFCVDISVNITIRDTVNFASYWCESIVDRTSLSYGGFFQSGQVNDLVGKSSCRERDMIPVKLFHDTTLCLQESTSSQPLLMNVYSNTSLENGCPNGTSQQLIAVINDNKVYACILKNQVFNNLKSPAILKGPYLESKFADDNFDRSFLVITLNGTSDGQVFLDSINNNITGYFDRYLRKLNPKKIKAITLGGKTPPFKSDVSATVLLAVFLMSCIVIMILLCLI
uniref:Macrophage-expressed gene 1 protein n=2 Tax=Panagrellus redivivus TaxID=6233 RepID=A0A7E4VYV4_PANRE